VTAETSEKLLEYARRTIPSPVRRILKRLAWASGLSGMILPAAEKNVIRMMEVIVRRGDICADVGANLGMITRLLWRLAGPEGKIIAFEAHPVNAKRMSESFLDEKFENITVENLADSDGSSGRAKLYPGRGNRSEEWNIVGKDVDGNLRSAELEIPAVSLDSYFEKYRRLDFFKIDVEGAAGLALSGMRRILTSMRPKVIVEFHDEAEWAARTILHQCGYSLYDMHGRNIEADREIDRVYHCVALPLGMKFPIRTRT